MPVLNYEEVAFAVCGSCGYSTMIASDRPITASTEMNASSSWPNTRAQAPAGGADLDPRRELEVEAHP